MSKDSHKEEGDLRLTPDAPLSPQEFDAARMARYQRLSLLTLDLAEKAGGAALRLSNAEGGNSSLARPGPHERPQGPDPMKPRLSAHTQNMTRAIWAHRVIEQLRARCGRETAARLRGADQGLARGRFGAKDLPRADLPSEKIDEPAPVSGPSLRLPSGALGLSFGCSVDEVSDLDRRSSFLSDWEEPRAAYGKLPRPVADPASSEEGPPVPVDDAIKMRTDDDKIAVGGISRRSDWSTIADDRGTWPRPTMPGQLTFAGRARSIGSARATAPP